MLRNIIASLLTVLVAVSLGSTFIGGCGGAQALPSPERLPVVGPSGRAYTVGVHGDSQDGRVEELAGRPLAVRVVDAEGKPVPGFHVTWQSLGGGGRLMVGADDEPRARIKVDTDSDGRSQVLLRYGKDLGVCRIEAVVHNRNNEEVFRRVFQETALDYEKLLFCLFGGLGLFLFGMKMMTDSLQVLAGDRLRYILEVLTRNRLVGLGVGAFVTAIIQSSSATTVMLVGFLNAGLMQLRQAIPIIFGANIGTTITGQMVAFNLGKYALPAIAVAFLLIMTASRKKYVNAGYVLMGFGLLFLGMETMSDVFKPLRSSPLVSGAFLAVGASPSLGFLVGLVATCILQSSSATVGLVITMAGSGLLGFEAAVPIIFGTNVGTTITAVLASLTANVAARRAATVHVAFNLVGSFIMLASLGLTSSSGHPLYYDFINRITAGDIFASQPENVARHVANAHTWFNVIFGFFFLPFSSLFDRLAGLIIGGEAEGKVTRLESHLLDNPELALAMTVAELEDMGRTARSMLVDAVEGFVRRDDRFYLTLAEREDEVDEEQSAITHYLVELSQHAMGPQAAERIPGLLHSVNDIERVADICENLMQLGERAIGRNLPFTDQAIEEIRRLYGKVLEMMDRVLLCLATDDRAQAISARHVEHDVNHLEDSYRRNHIRRLKEGECNPVSGIVFLDFIGNLEKIGDHLDNVAQAFSYEVQHPD